MSGEVTSIKQALIMTLYVSAARTVATIEQAAKLRREVLPALENYRHHQITEFDLMDIVDSVMGDWDIPDDFADHLTELGFTPRTPGK